MSNYIKATNFASKDALPTGNAAKTVSGTEIDDEFTALSTSIATKANTSSPTLTGTPAAPTAGVGTNTTQIATTAFVQAAATAATINALVYPVGAIFTTTLAYTVSELATQMGVGTWAAFGAGRVLLGAGSVTDNQPVPVTQVFTAGDTEGELSHTNTVAETASHDHKLFADETVAPDYHTSNVTASTSVAKSTGNGQPAEGYITRAGTVDATLGLSSDTGSGDAHNNLQPYIVVYFWKRTA